MLVTLQWHHNERDDVSNCLPNRLFRRRSKNISELRVTGLCAGNSPVTVEFLAQRVSSAENVSIWWRHPENLVEHWIIGNWRSQPDTDYTTESYSWISSSILSYNLSSSRWTNCGINLNRPVALNHHFSMHDDVIKWQSRLIFSNNSR